MVDFNQWKQTVLGVGLDVDGAFGKQCVDVVLSWGQACFPGVHWSVLFPSVPAAKDMFASYNPAYFDRVANDHANVNQLPPQGAVAIFDGYDAAHRPEGYTSNFTNPEGHTGVVDHADQRFVYLVQQDGSQAGAVTELVQRSWKYTPCLGWLIPKSNAAPAPAPTIGDGRIGRTLYLHGVPSWRVYRVGAAPVPQNTLNFLRPEWFHNGPNGQPGLQYKILGVSKYPNTVTIKTDSFGLVDIFVDKDAEIL